MPGRIWIAKTLYKSGFRSGGSDAITSGDPSEWIIDVQSFDDVGCWSRKSSGSSYHEDSAVHTGNAKILRG
jgi:hypothetical protein